MRHSLAVGRRCAPLAALRAALLFASLLAAAQAAFAQAPPVCTPADELQLVREHRFEEALASKQERLKQLPPPGDNPAQLALSICMRASIGAFLNRLERTGEALAILEPLAKEAKDKLGPDHAQTLNAETMLAASYHRAAQYDREISLLQALRPRTAKRYGPRSLEMATLLRNLSTAYHWIRNYADALPLDREVIAIARERLQRPGACPVRRDCLSHLARSQSNLAESLRRLDRPAEALPQVEQALATMIEINGPTHPDTLDTRLVLAGVYIQLRELQKALEIEQDVLALAERYHGPDHPVTRKARNNLAVTTEATGNRGKAIEMDEQQLALLRQKLGVNHPETLLNLSNLSERYLAAGQVDKALPLIEEAIGSMLNTRAGLAFDERLTLSWQAGWRRLVDNYIGALLLKRRIADAFLTVEFFKAHLLADRLSFDPAERHLAESDRGELRRLRRSLGSIEQALALKRSLGQPTVKEDLARADLLKRMAAFTQDAPAARIALPTAKQPPDWYFALLAAEQNSARVSYLLLGNFLGVFIDQGAQIQAVRIGKAEGVKETIEAYRLLMRAQAGPGKPPDVWLRADGGYTAGAKPTPQSEPVTDPAPLAAYLSEMLIKPLTGYLKGKSRIVISPDQLLAHVPFDALTLEGVRLGDAAEVTLIPSFALYASLEQRKRSYAQTPRAALLAFGGAYYQRVTQLTPLIAYQRERAPELLPMDIKVVAQSVRKNPDKLFQAFAAYSLGPRDLPGSLAEVRGIAQAIGSRDTLVYTGEQASEANLYRLADEGRLQGFRALHFAAHGFLSDDEPGLSAIVLSQINRAPGTDGYVTVAEIAALEIRSDLVVISACDSGVGKLSRGEGVLGMSYALFQAGTVASMVTLWPIPDKETVSLMTHFYEEWKEGVSPARALSLTKRWGLGKGMPAYAVDAFVLYGS